VFISLGLLFYLLAKSIKNVPLVMTGLFSTLAINVIVSLFQVLWITEGSLIRESPRFLELAFWFPLVSTTAYLAFDVRKGLYAILGLWAIVVPALVVNLIRTPETNLVLEKLAFMVRFLVVNALFVMLIDLWARVNAVALTNEAQARIQEVLANTDDLTGIPNRRSITKRLASEFKLAEQTKGTFSIIAFDIRSFKTINDRFGHPYGDKILIDVANKGKSIIRPVDIIARFGGDEFLILLANTNEKSARRIAERFRDLVQNIELPDGSRLDIAIGIASSVQHKEPYAMITEADRDLYN
jgi:diguanylate cyclase (GGDEF)-like protein